MLRIVYLFSLFAILHYCVSLFSSTTYAYNFFDDFDSYEQTNWSFAIPLNNSISIADSIAQISKINNYKFPFLSINLSNEDIYEIEFKFKFSGNPNYGAGIAASSEVLSYWISEHPKLENTIFMVWPKPNNGFGIFTPLCKSNTLICITDDKPVFEGNSNVDYTFKVVFSNQIYKFFVNNIEIFTSSSTNQKILDFWIGNPQETGYVTWPEIFIDYVNINKSTKNNPIVIVPGLGASWDYEAMFKGKDGSNWKIPSFVKNYDSLITSFENVGYTLNRDLFIFSYDWRKPVNVTSSKLDTFIKTYVNSSKKISIVGHSMGGLIARDYLQNYSQDKVDKVITLGTPHKGAVDAYSLWEGATLWDDIWWGKLAIEASVQLNGTEFESRVNTLKKQIPSIKCLLPTFNYIRNNGVSVNWNEMNQNNSYLSSLNGDFVKTINNVYAINGKNNKTRSWVITEDRLFSDKVLDLWEDGKPVTENSFEYLDGDGTVLENSASFDIANKSNYSVNHFNLPANKDVIEGIFEILGLDKSKVILKESDDRKNVLAFFLRSPGKLSVCNLENVCDSNLGIYLSDQKMFFIPNYQDQTLELKVKEDGKGRYKVHVGKLSDTADWEVFEGNIVNNGQSDDFLVISDNGNLRLQSTPETNKKLLSVCKDDLNQVVSNWDKNGNLEKMTNESNQKSIKLRSFRITTSLLGNLLDFGVKSNNQDFVAKTLDCWEKINVELNNILGEDKNDYAQKNLTYTDRLFDIIDSKFTTNVSLGAFKIRNRAGKLFINGKGMTNNSSKISSELASSMDKMLLYSYFLR